MRSLALPDGSLWRLEAVSESIPSGDTPVDRRRRRSLSNRSWVWVRCQGPALEFRLMFGAAWALWSDAALARALEMELDRLRPLPRAG